MIHAVASRTSAHLYAFLVSRTEFERAMVFAVTNALRKLVIKSSYAIRSGKHMDSMYTNGVCRAMDVIHKCRPRTMFGYVCMMSCNIYPARTCMVFNGRGVGVWDLIFLQN